MGDRRDQRPDAGFYRDARVRSDLAQIESVGGHIWARPVAPGSVKNMTIYVDTPDQVNRRAGPEFIDLARRAASLTLGGSRTTAR